MILIIDLSNESCLVLKRGRKKIAGHCWAGLYQLSETLVKKIGQFLEKNKVGLEQIDRIKVVPSQKSIISDRIAKAVALGLKFK